MLHLSNKRKGKEILNNNLAALPSHNIQPDSIPIRGVYYPYSQWDNTVEINGICYEVD